MASKPPITNPAFTKFVSALTETDQLNEAEKKAAASDLKRAMKDKRYVAWMTADAMALAALSAGKLACCARCRDLKDENQGQIEARYLDAVYKMMDAVDAFFGLPVIRVDDLADRRKLLKLAKSALAYCGKYQSFRDWHDAKLAVVAA